MFDEASQDARQVVGDGFRRPLPENCLRQGGPVPEVVARTQAAPAVAGEIGAAGRFEAVGIDRPRHERRHAGVGHHVVADLPQGPGTVTPDHLPKGAGEGDHAPVRDALDDEEILPCEVPDRLRRAGGAIAPDDAAGAEFVAPVPGAGAGHAAGMAPVGQAKGRVGEGGQEVGPVSRRVQTLPGRRVRPFEGGCETRRGHRASGSRQRGEEPAVVQDERAGMRVPLRAQRRDADRLGLGLRDLGHLDRGDGALPVGADSAAPCGNPRHQGGMDGVRDHGAMVRPHGDGDKGPGGAEVDIGRVAWTPEAV